MKRRSSSSARAPHDGIEAEEIEQKFKLFKIVQTPAVAASARSSSSMGASEIGRTSFSLDS